MGNVSYEKLLDPKTVLLQHQEKRGLDYYTNYAQEISIKLNRIVRMNPADTAKNMINKAVPNHGKDSGNGGDLQTNPLLVGSSCPGRDFTHVREFMANLPYIAMVVLGSSILLVVLPDDLWRLLSGGLYLLYGVGGAFWVMLFLCPYCNFHGTRLCPCGYGQIAAKLRAKKDNDDFAKQFRKHISVIVPLWVIPLVIGAVFMLGEFSWPLMGLLVAFAVNSFLILPLLSRYSCSRCLQKNACPWMSRGGLG